MTEATPKPITVEKLKEAREMDAQINSSRNDAEYSTATNGVSLLEKFRESYNSLSSTEISEMMDLQNPPPSLMLVCAASCMILGIEPSKKPPNYCQDLFNSINFSNMDSFLHDYENGKRTISDGSLKKVKSICQDAKFQYDEQKKVSEVGVAVMFFCKAFLEIIEKKVALSTETDQSTDQQIETDSNKTAEAEDDEIKTRIAKTAALMSRISPFRQLFDSKYRAVTVENVEEVLNLADPPINVSLVLSCTCTLLDLKADESDMKKFDYFSIFKKYASDDTTKVLYEAMNDKIKEVESGERMLPSNVYKKVKAIMLDSNFKEAEKLNVFMGALCCWCRAMIDAYMVNVCISRKRSAAVASTAQNETQQPTMTKDESSEPANHDKAEHNQEVAEVEVGSENPSNVESLS